MPARPKSLSRNEALRKIQRYCAYQERCVSQVRDKLARLGVNHKTREELINQLAEDGFVDEERFARAYARGKFRQRQWGKIKIRLKLQEKQLSPECIAKGLEELSGPAYEETLRGLLAAKMQALDEPDLFVRRQKAARLAIRKGFEPGLVWQILKEEFPG